MRAIQRLGILLATASCLALAAKCPYRPIPVDGRVIELAGLEGTVRVVTDQLGVPHIYAESDTDLARVQGWIHARDRFFQMDSSRRRASGTYAELIGYTALTDESDPGTRLLGLRLAAARSEALLTPSTRASLEAYAEGVNAYLAAHPLPPEYDELLITSVPEWSVLDSLAIAKAFDAQFQYPDSLDTAFFDSVVAACEAATPPCDGWALLDEDVGRWAPMDPTATIPDATGSFPFDPELPALASLEPRLLGGAGTEARRIAARSGEWSWRRGDALGFGSNAWGVAAEHSATGHPMVATDGHTYLQTPPMRYENHLVVNGDPAMNVSGTTIPGIPLVLGGLNGRIAWGATVNYSDRSDAFLDRLLRDAPGCPARLCIESEGQLHPVEERTETYRYNNSPFSGIPDDLVDGTFLVRAIAPETVDVLTVPFRSFGPVVVVEDRSVIDDPAPSSLETTVTTWQYAGLHGTRESEAVVLWVRARDVFEFREGVKLFAGVSQNWVVGDVEGNLAYFTSGEIPLRADLEAGGVVDRPDLIQDGSGPNNWIADPARSQGQTIPYQVLPFDEMPQTVNPANGFVVTANNDPAGALLDNDPLNQYRRGRSSIYYANTYDTTAALRAGRITGLLREKIEAGEKISVDDMKRIQANTQQPDAELMMPFLLQAGANTEAPGAPAELASLAADPGVAEALSRLTAWDFSTPTGIPEGYDGSDIDGARDPEVSPAEAEASVAATLYNVWRAHAMKNSMDRAMQAIGVRPVSGNFPLRGLQHLISQDPFTGVGASGVDFFPEPSGLAADERRDVVLLQALRDALDDLASNQYADAFGGSTDQDDYRWGKLNRVSFPHPLGSPYSTPRGYFFEDLADNLPGLARDGGAYTVSPTGIDPGASGAHAFESSFGSNTRLVMVAGNPEGGDAPMVGWNAMPGGASGYPFSPFRETQLGIWLTADHHPILTLEPEVQASAWAEEQFVPPIP